MEEQRGLNDCARHLGGRNSPLIQPTALDSSGSNATVLVSVWPHLGHSNVRCSKPSGPSETAVVAIRASQSGQRGRIGSSSGGGLSGASMTLTQRWIEPVDARNSRADNHSQSLIQLMKTPSIRPIPDTSHSS